MFNSIFKGQWESQGHIGEQHHQPAEQEGDCDILCQFLLVQANRSSLSKKINH